MHKVPWLERGQRAAQRERSATRIALAGQQGGVLELCGLLRAMMQNEQLIAPQGEFRVRLTIVVAELDLIGIIEEFDNGASASPVAAAYNNIRCRSSA